MSVITVTLNPAIDETVVLDTLRPGHVHRASAVSFHAGGKGVNVASCLADWKSGPVTAACILGQNNTALFDSLFAAKHIIGLCVPVPGNTRTNIKLSHDGDTTDINLPGLKITAEAATKFRDLVVKMAAPDTIVLLAGSVPEGIGNDIYAEMTEMMNAGGARVVLDTSGAPLTAALNAKHLPYCIKPNRSELEAFCKHALPTNDDLIAAARGLNARGIALVVVSLGAEGSLYVSGDSVLHASLPAIRATSTVGAGDAMVAGIIAALQGGADLEGIARLATAFAAAKLGQAGPNLPGREVIKKLAEQVKIIELREGTKT